VIVRSLQRHGVPARNRAATMIVYFFGYYVAYVLAGTFSILLFLHYAKLNKVLFGVVGLFFLGCVSAPAFIFWLTHKKWKPPPWARRIRWLHRAERTVKSVPPDLLRNPALLFQVIRLQLLAFALAAVTLEVVL